MTTGRETVQVRFGSLRCGNRPVGVAAQPRGRDGVEEVGELAIARAAHLGEPAGPEQEALQRAVVRPRVPRLEVLADRERRPVARVARREAVPERAVGLALGLPRRQARLVGEEVVVHRHDAERVPDERQLGQREAPEPALAPRPPAERRLAARVVAEAAPGEHRVEDAEVPLEARRPRADDLAPPEAGLRPGPEEQCVELVELLLPVGRGPLAHAAGERRAEVADEVGGDLVPVAVARRDPPPGAGDGEVAGRQREPDRRGAGLVPRRLVARAVRPVDQVRAADEEGEVSVRAASDGAPVAPHPRAAGAVERGDDELRRPCGRRCAVARTGIRRRYRGGRRVARRGTGREPAEAEEQRHHQEGTHAGIVGAPPSGSVQARFKPRRSQAEHGEACNECHEVPVGWWRRVTPVRSPAMPLPRFRAPPVGVES